MFLKNTNTAKVPARHESGSNSGHLFLWRLVHKTQTLRVACLLGEFSVWREGAHERQLFRINLGVLAEVTRRTQREIHRARKARPGAAGLVPLTDAEVAAIWRACAADPEVRFSATLRITPDDLGGWRRCLDLSGQLLQAQGRPVPWTAEWLALTA